MSYASFRIFSGRATRKCDGRATKLKRRAKQMTQSNKAALITPADPNKDQVSETRRVLREMNDAADRAIDDQLARSTPMTPKK